MAITFAGKGPSWGVILSQEGLSHIGTERCTKWLLTTVQKSAECAHALSLNLQKFGQESIELMKDGTKKVLYGIIFLMCQCSVNV